MTRSLMGKYEEIKHQRQDHTCHWKSVLQGPECSLVQWQHKRMAQNYSRSSTRVSTLTTLFNIFLEKTICEALDGHEGSVSIGGRLITNFRFADDIVVNAEEEEEEAGVLIDRLDTTTTRYKMAIGLDRTKVMTNNPNGFQREISNDGSKPEILSRIAQTTAALSRLKIIWRDKNIWIASTVKLLRTLILSTFLYACES